MRNFIALAILALAAVGCQTTNVLKEPGRSGYYYACLGAGIHVTTCGCMEDSAVKETGFTKVDETNSEKFFEALFKAQEACAEKTEKLIEEGK